MDYTAMISSVDFATALVAAGTVFAALALFKAGIKGGRMLLGVLR